MIKKFITWIKSFFISDDKEVQIEERIAYLSSIERMNLAKQSSYQELQKTSAFNGNHADGNEIEIRGECSQVDILLTNNYQNICSPLIIDINAHSNKASSDISAQLIGVGAQGADAEIQACIASARSVMGDSRDKVAYTLNTLTIFKGANGINWEAEFPDSSKAAIIYIGIAMIAEAIANIFFLREGASTVNAILISALVALLNVGISAFLGTTYRWKNHINKNEHLKGTASLFLTLFFVILLNSLIAFFRIYIAKEANVSILTPAFYLESFLLYFAGISLGMYAFNKGYRIDDVYPGYGKVYRDWLLASEERSFHVEEFRVATGAVFSKIDRKLISLRNQINYAQKEFDNLVSTLSHAIGAWSANRKILNNAYKALISSYRGVANAHLGAVSKTPPAYFQEDVDLGESILFEESKLILEKINKDTEAREKSIISNYQKIDHARNDLLVWSATKMQPLIEGAI